MLEQQTNKNAKRKYNLTGIQRKLKENQFSIKLQIHKFLYLCVNGCVCVCVCIHI